MKINAGLWCKLTFKDKMILLKTISQQSLGKKAA